MDEKLTMQTKDLTEENVEKIAQLFPSCVTEAVSEDGSIKRLIDFEALKRQLSGDIIPEGKERYVFTWPGKSEAQRLAYSSLSKTLRPIKSKSINYETTRNVYIEGDNLEALKILHETYLATIKMIYIDPPYNTGDDYVYNDRFVMNDLLFTQQSGDFDEYGQKLTPNVDGNGRFHTNWLNMMYPRLLLSRDLLKENGVIFVSIGNQELAQLKMIMDEIFGYNNCVGIIDWESKTKCQNTKTAKRQLQNKQEYILVYKKGLSRIEFNLRVIGSRSYPDSDDRGRYRIEPIGEMAASGIRARDSMIFDINGVMPKPGNQWKVGKDTVNDYSNRGDLLIINGRACFKIRPDDEDDQTEPFWSFISKDIGTAESANSALKKLIGENGFDTIKPVQLLSKLIYHSTDKDDIVLDFFAGSGTTGHAVMELSHDLRENRKFILIQIPEPCREGSDSFKAGYSNVSDICLKRLQTVSHSFKSQAFLDSFEMDYGFRVFKVDSSNMNDVYYNPRAVTKDLLQLSADNIKADRSPEDLLFQVMMELGIELSARIKTEAINGKQLFDVDDGYLIACFDTDIDDTLIESIAKRQPKYAVFRDSSMKSDAVAINFSEIFKTYGPNTTTKVL